MASRVGIISPYRAQVQLIRALFQEYPSVNVDTVVCNLITCHFIIDTDM